MWYNNNNTIHARRTDDENMRARILSHYIALFYVYIFVPLYDCDYRNILLQKTVRLTWGYASVHFGLDAKYNNCVCAYDYVVPTCRHDDDVGLPYMRSQQTRSVNVFRRPLVLKQKTSDFTEVSPKCRFTNFFRIQPFSRPYVLFNWDNNMYITIEQKR
jgi:hypothetical protein